MALRSVLSMGFMADSSLANRGNNIPCLQSNHSAKFVPSGELKAFTCTC
jgi:hypothetical protein